MPPIVTVILTVFQRTRYLEAALRSVLAQTFSDLELIVSDDAGSEAARAICAKFGSDGRLRYRRNLATLGAPLNIAAALREARGEFLTILNDDDLMEPCMLERLLPPLQQSAHCVVSFGDHWLIDSQGALLEEATDRNSRLWGRSALESGVVKNPFALALHGGIPFVMGTLVRKYALQPDWLVREIGSAYDYWLALRLSRSGGRFVYVPSRVFRYRLHDDSESARLHPRKAEPQVFIFSKLLKEKMSDSERSEVRRILSHFLFVLGRDHLYFHERTLARAAFSESLRVRVRLKTCLGLAASLLPDRPVRLAAWLWRRTRGIRQELPGGSAESGTPVGGRL